MLYRSTRSPFTGTGTHIVNVASDNLVSANSYFATIRDPKIEVDPTVIAYLAFEKEVKQNKWNPFEKKQNLLVHYPIGVNGKLSNVSNPIIGIPPCVRPIIQVSVKFGQNAYILDKSKCTVADLNVNDAQAIEYATKLKETPTTALTMLPAQIIDPIPDYVITDQNETIVAYVDFGGKTYSVDRSGTVSELAGKKNTDLTTIVLDGFPSAALLPIIYPFKTIASLIALKTKLFARQHAIKAKETAERNRSDFNKQNITEETENETKLIRAKRGVKAAVILENLCGVSVSDDGGTTFPESVLSPKTCATMSAAITALKRGEQPMLAEDHLSDTKSVANSNASADVDAGTIVFKFAIGDSAAAGVVAATPTFRYYKMGGDSINPVTAPTPDSAIEIEESGSIVSNDAAEQESAKQEISNHSIGRRIMDILSGGDEDENKKPELLQMLRADGASYALVDGNIVKTAYAGGRRSRKRMNKNKRASSRHSRRHSRRHKHGHNSRKRYSAGSKSKRRYNQKQQQQQSRRQRQQ